MDSLVDQEQHKKGAVFYVGDNSDSNSSETSHRRSEESYRKRSTRSRTSESRIEKRYSGHFDANTPGLPLRMTGRLPLSHSVPVLLFDDDSSAGHSHDKSSLSRVSYQGSSPKEYQVRYVGGYQSGPEDHPKDNELSPIRVVSYDRSPSRSRRSSESQDVSETRRSEGNSLSSSDASEEYRASFASVFNAREEREQSVMSMNASRTPTGSPYVRRRTLDQPDNLWNQSHSAGSSPVPAPRQKKTAVVSPLLDMSDSRPRSLPPGLVMVDPTDPESERVEQVSRVVNSRVHLLSGVGRVAL